MGLIVLGLILGLPFGALALFVWFWWMLLTGRLGRR